MSVLFCDLVGFTAASEAADPEDVRARIRPYHASLRHELERYGGTVEKFIGDAVMAVFGAPVAHEDDPERAVRAGLRIIEAIAELNEREPELELQVRVGINTGQAVVSLHARPEQGEGIVAGDVVNTAARIQSAAPVNERGRLGGDVPADRAGRSSTSRWRRSSVKGKSEPLRLYRAVEARARFGSDLIRTQETLFVGREVEKTLLQGLFDRCARDSTVRARDARGRARGRQEPAVRGAVPLHRRAARADPLAAGSLPAVRRGDHVLGARRARQVACRDVRVGLAGGGGREAGAGAAGGRGARLAQGEAAARCSGSTPASPHRARSRSRPGGASSSRSPRTGPRSSSSRTCTGPTRRCSTSCRTSRSGRRACRCCSSAPPARSCSRSTAPGAPGRAMRTRSICPRSRSARRASSCRACSNRACRSR